MSNFILRESLIPYSAHRSLEGIKEARKSTAFPRSDQGLPWDLKWVQLKRGEASGS